MAVWEWITLLPFAIVPDLTQHKGNKRCVISFASIIQIKAGIELVPYYFYDSPLLQRSA
jgi:hypothetical protein